MNQKTLLVIAFIFTILFTNFVSAIPGTPNQFYGSIIYNNQPAPDGLTLTAKINGVEVARTTTLNETYGYYPNKFMIEDPDNNRSGKTINFFVNGIDTDQTAIFQNGAVVRLDLFVSGPPITTTVSGGGGGGGPVTTTVQTTTTQATTTTVPRKSECGCYCVVNDTTCTIDPNNPYQCCFEGFPNYICETWLNNPDEFKSCYCNFCDIRSGTKSFCNLYLTQDKCCSEISGARVCANWVSVYVGSDNKNIGTPSCTVNTDYRIDYAKYDSISKKLTVKITNTGSLYLYGLSIGIGSKEFFESISITSTQISLSRDITITNPLKPGESLVMTLDLVNEPEKHQTFTEMRVSNSICPEFYVETTDIGEIIPACDICYPHPQCNRIYTDKSVYFLSQNIDIYFVNNLNKTVNVDNIEIMHYRNPPYAKFNRTWIDLAVLPNTKVKLMTWDQKDNNGDQVPEGDYWITVGYSTKECSRPVHTEFEIKSVECSPCFSYFAYIDHDNTVVKLRNGARKIIIGGVIHGAGDNIEYLHGCTSFPCNVIISYIDYESEMSKTDTATLKGAKTISILDASCDKNGEITLVVSNDGSSNIEDNEIVVKVNEIDKSDFYDFGTILPRGTKVVSDLVTSYSGSVSVLLVGPSNSVQQIIWCPSTTTTAPKVDKTKLLEILILLEQTRINFDQLKGVSESIAKYYESVGKSDKKKCWEDVVNMFDKNIGEIDSIKSEINKIKDNPTQQDIERIRDMVSNFRNNVDKIIDKILECV